MKQQHTHAIKVSETLKKLGIPEAGRDKYGNPYIEAKHLPRLPANMKPNYEKHGCFRICLKSH